MKQIINADIATWQHNQKCQLKLHKKKKKIPNYTKKKNIRSPKIKLEIVNNREKELKNKNKCNIQNDKTERKKKQYYVGMISIKKPQNISIKQK